MSADPSSSNGAVDSPKPIWVFTASRTDPEVLEYILVQRHKLLEDAVERVRESALTRHKHHLLFVGPRGCGKTHLVTLVVSRLDADVALDDKLRIARLNEDETCTTVLELLVKIHGALEKRYPREFREEALEAAYNRKPGEAVDFISRKLLSALGSRTLLVVTENLDAIFEGLGDGGQKQLRAFIQENSRLTFVATAQRLVEDLSKRESPFFGFFQTEHLKPLNVDEATDLLRNIARLKNNGSLVEFLSTGRGRARVRALHHLSGGNHRIYIVLSQFITRDSIDALLAPFLKMVDELTPYYQERIRWLPPLQRKIVEYLCGCESTVPVKEIARRLFATPPTISSQLQDLREKGYVEANQRGRESLYEISEPLMRICVEVKEIRGHEPLRLIVDFLRVWYDDPDLKNRLGAMEAASESRAYLESAIQRNTLEGNLRKKILLKDIQLSLPQGMNAAVCENLLRALESLPEAVTLYCQNCREGNSHEAERCLDEAIDAESVPVDKAELLLFRAERYLSAGRPAEALEDYNRLIELPSAPVEQVAQALLKRGLAHGRMGDKSLEIRDYTAAVRLPRAQPEQIAVALINRGIAYGRIGETEHEIGDYTAVIELSCAPVKHVANALIYRGVTYGQVGETQHAIADYTAVIGLPGTPLNQVAMALFNRGIAYGEIGETERGIDDYTAIVELPNAPAEHVAAALVNRGIIYGHAGETRRALGDFRAVVELRGAPVEEMAMALVNRGIAYGEMGETQHEIADYTAVIELAGAPVDQVARALVYRGITHGKTGETHHAIDDYTAVTDLPDVPVAYVASALVYRGITYGQAGDDQRAIDDYTTVIELDGAPVERVAFALVCRSATYARLGERRCVVDDCTAVIELPGAPPEHVAMALVGRGLMYTKMRETQHAIADYTAVIERSGAPVEMIAQALFNRGFAHRWAGETRRAVDDYTVLIGLAGAPSAQVAMALLDRGSIFRQEGRKQEAKADFEALIRLPSAPTTQMVNAHLALSALHCAEGQWGPGFQTLDAGLKHGANAQPSYHASSTTLVRVVFSAGLSPEGRREKVREILRLYHEYRALPVLSEGLIQHLGNVFKTGEPFPSTDNVEDWGSAWEHAAADVPDFRLALRLLRTAVNFLKAGGKDRGILLDLASAERSILEQAFGLAEGELAEST